MTLKISITCLITAGLFGLTIKNYRWGLYLFVLFCPIIPPALSIYINDSIPLITFQRIMLIVLVSVWMVKYLMGQVPKIEKPPLIELIVIFVGLVFISSIFAPQPKDALKEFFSERIIGIPIVYFLVFQSVHEEKTVKQLICILLASGLIIGIFGILDEILQKNIFYEIGKYLLPVHKLNSLGFNELTIYGNTRYGITRAQSSFPIANGLSAYLVFILPFALSMVTFIKRKFLIISMLLGITILLISLFSTGSTGGYFGLAIMFIILWRTKKLMIKLAIIFLSILVVLCGVYFTEVASKEKGFSRFWQLYGTLQISLKHPLGMGLTTFNKVVIVPVIPGETIHRVADGYSYPQQILVETGILSFIVLLILWIQILLKMRQSSINFRLIHNHFWDKISWALFTAFLTNFLLSIMAHSILTTFNGFIIFWITVSIAMRLWLISKENSACLKNSG